MNILLSGCSRGIGLQILQVLLNSDKVETVFALSSNINRLPKHSSIVAVEVDFMTDLWMDKVIEYVNDKEIHGLINNAGYLYNGKTGAIPQYEINKMLTINYSAPLQLIQGLLDNLKRGKAHIVNIGSMGGVSEVQNSLDYLFTVLQKLHWLIYQSAGPKN